MASANAAADGNEDDMAGACVAVAESCSGGRDLRTWFDFGAVADHDHARDFGFGVWCLWLVFWVLAAATKDLQQ
jgi:hypothetical protein